MTPSPNPTPTGQMAPVDEVMIGISFRPVANLMPSIIATFREQLKAEYPQFQYQPRLADPNPFGTTVINPQQLFAAPQWPGALGQDPFARIWLVSSDDAKLLQLQSDRLVANWRKRVEPYPGFSSVLAKFTIAYQLLLQSLEQAGGQLETTLLEVAYFDWLPVDAIAQGSALKFAEAAQFEVDSATLVPDPQNWNGSFTVNRDNRSPARLVGQVQGNVMRIIGPSPSVQIGSLVTWTCYVPLEPGTLEAELMNEILFAKQLLRRAFDSSTTDEARQRWEISE